MRCKHLNCEIIEYAEECMSYLYENGQYASDAAGTGKLLDYIDVVCEDCGMNHRYYRSSLPKWLKFRIQGAIKSRIALS
jgi:RNase P subunit RPR2